MPNSNAWSDEPINVVSKDSFGREPFARLLAETINRVQSGSASTVFGLVGRWGSGKSSVAAMVEELLPPDTWIVQPFTPWATTGTAALQAEFVAALDAALGGELASKEAGKATLQKYVKWASPMLAAFGIGQPLVEITSAVLNEVTARKPWSVEFGALAELLQTIDKRVLMVCDDIDRLDAVELLEFLKVVRLLGRFPNVHYLVAYDADTVEDLLAAEGIGGRTSSFMEKIVQHPFELPQIDSATRWRHISRAVTKSLGKQDIRLNEAGMERYRLLIDALVEGLLTPRQIARFENHLNVLSTLVPGEVDFLDFAALANLRLNHHDIYEALLGWTSELQTGLRSPTNEEGLTEKDWIARFKGLSRRADITGAWGSVSFLFPQTRALYGEPLHPQAFSSSNYMERYYSLGVPENDVSDVMVSRAISSLLGRAPDEESEAAVLKVLSTAHSSTARLAIEKLRERRRSVLDDKDSLAKLIQFLLSEYKRAESSRHDPESSLDVIFGWLSDEVLRGYNAGQFSREELLKLFGEETSLSILLKVDTLRVSSRDERTKKIMADFADHFLDPLVADSKSALEPLGTLRLRLSLVSRAKGREALAGLLDSAVDDDVAAFEAVAIAMVRTEHWVGGEGVRKNIAFETRDWTAAVSPKVRARMAARLTGEFDSEWIDPDDLSDQNRRRMAISSVRSEYGLGDSANDG